MLLWPGATLLSAGLALVLSELFGLVRNAPGERTLVVSRIGVSLACLHVVAALVLGAVVFSHGDHPFAGVVHDRWLLVHLHLAVLGWVAMLILTVGRTLGPMLALAPTAPPRRLPVAECALAVGVWLLLAGIAVSSNALALAGGVLVMVTLATFGRFMARVARKRRLPLEAPLAHLLAGVLFLLQAAGLGVAILFGALSPHRGLVAYVTFLLLGWAVGVTLGHLGKLLSLSLWVWWPPGPRPKQDALYPRAVWLAESAAFGLGVELLAAGSLAGTTSLARAGASLLIAASALAVTGAALTWTRRPTRRTPDAAPPSEFGPGTRYAPSTPHRYRCPLRVSARTANGSSVAARKGAAIRRIASSEALREDTAGSVSSAYNRRLRSVGERRDRSRARAFTRRLRNDEGHPDAGS